MKVSGFTFGHNLIDSGYPIIEAIDAIRDYVNEIVFVDMQSTDTTRQVVEALGCRVLEGQWGNQAGKTLAIEHLQHCFCENDIIWHFEADEVFSEELAYNIYYQIETGQKNLLVPRLQVEQNFQRCRWYPELVHRVFLKGTVKKIGHTTDLHHQINMSVVEGGYLWDCTNCFRNNWLYRVNKQAELWNEPPRYRYVPIHFKHSVELDRQQADDMLNEPQWISKESPFDLPVSLRKLVGVTRYSDSEGYKRLMG